MTYAIQAIAGVVVAAGAVAAILWRKAKKKVAKTLKLDEKSTKETEEDVQLVEDDTPAEQAAENQTENQTDR